ncbi:MAG: sialidase family protein [Cyclobacteriaceae bacterium]
MYVLERGDVPKLPEALGLGSLTFPNIEVLPSGRWLLGFKAADKKKDGIKMQAMMTWSDDFGKTWAAPYVPFQIPKINEVPGKSQSLYFLSLGGERVLMVINWVDSSAPHLPYYDTQDESLKDTRIFYSFSENNGLDWSILQLMDTSMLGGPVPLTGPPMRLGDGSLICQFEINKYKSDPKKWVHRSALLFSGDEGKTWGDPVLVTNYPDMYYWDQRPNVLADGYTLVNFFWTLDGRKNAYLNIHRSISRNGGRSWTYPEDTGIYGQPGRPVEIMEGKLATIDIDRTKNPTITVRISSDEGRTFDEDLVVFQASLPQQDSRYIKMNDAWAEMAQFSVGHPHLVYLGKEELLAYFYQGRHPDHTGISYVKISIK